MGANSAAALLDIDLAHSLYAASSRPGVARRDALAG